MGVWQLFTGVAAALSGVLAHFAVVKKHATPLVSNPVYVSAFGKITLMTLVLAVLALVLIPYIRTLITENN